MKLRHWRVKLACISFICICSWVIYMITSSRCSNSDTKKRINELCALYESGTISGDLCEPLCRDFAIRPLHCLGHRHGKSVITATWDGAEVILKAKSFNITEYRREWAGGYESETLDAYRKSVLVLLRTLHGIHVPANRQEPILDQLWSHRFNWKECGKRDLNAAMRSLWSLLMQHEYAPMQYYQDYPHVPRIYGTCGYLYAVKSISTSEVFNLNPLSSYKNLWSDRVPIALSFLDLAEDLDTQFPEPMHMCDVQPSNFGSLLESDGHSSSSSQQPVVALIDMDMVCSEMFLKDTRNTPCLVHEDCDFFDCKGQCVKGACVDARANNNLQSICEDIFATNIRTGLPGLLLNPPQSVRDDLESVLYSCIHPNLPDGSLRTPKETLTKLRELLMNSYSV